MNTERSFKQKMNELVRVVASDLDYLAGMCSQNRVSDDDLRRCSVQLRSLLVEQNLLMAWRKFGFKGQPTIIAPRLESEAYDLSRVWLGIAGGGTYEGITGSLIVGRVEGVNGICLPPKATLELPSESELKHHYPFKLSGFVDAWGIVVNGKTVRRSEVIKYVANRLGGAHYDERRLEGAFVALDKAVLRLNFFGKNPVYYELLAIAQLMANAPDIQKFREAVRVEPTVSALTAARSGA
jgi:hypothetical protein